MGDNQTNRDNLAVSRLPDGEHAINPVMLHKIPLHKDLLCTGTDHQDWSDNDCGDEWFDMLNHATYIAQDESETTRRVKLAYAFWSKQNDDGHVWEFVYQTERKTTKDTRIIHVAADDRDRVYKYWFTLGKFGALINTASVDMAPDYAQALAYSKGYTGTIVEKTLNKQKGWQEPYWVFHYKHEDRARHKGPAYIGIYTERVLRAPEWKPGQEPPLNDGAPERGSSPSICAIEQ